MTTLSDKELNVRQQLALHVYLDIYKQLIDLTKPSMGLVEVDKALVLEIFNTMCSGDLVIDITNAVPRGIARPSLRSYISSAGYIENVYVYTEMLSILRDPNTPPYFRGFRAALCQRLVNTLRKKSWGMGDIIVMPHIVMDTTGYAEVTREIKITMRLRDIPDGKRKEN